MIEEEEQKEQEEQEEEEKEEEKEVLRIVERESLYALLTKGVTKF